MRKELITTIILFFISHISYSQSPTIVKSDSITYPVHRNNIGKIAYMEKPIAIDNFSEKDFLSAYEFKENSDLNIRVFMENSLTNYLHRLSPTSTVEELTSNGNYHFTFFINNKIIYQENLNPGAGSAESKNTRTVFRVPLISSTNEDSWGRFLWNRFMMRGGEDALSVGQHNLTIEIRPYIKFDSVVIGDIIAKGSLTINIPEKVIDKNLITIQSIYKSDDWKISTAPYDQLLIENLNRKIAEKKFKNITSIVVIKNGELLIEEYFNGATRDSLHDTRSVGKSFCSAIMGIAIKEGHIKSENQTLREFYNLKNFKNYTQKKDSITLKNLLTMSSGFEGSDMNESSPGNEENMYPTDNWVEFTLNLPMDKSKVSGKDWDYFTAGVVILGDVLDKSVPGGLEKYSSEKLFKPLGITNYEWQYTPQKVANTAGGLKMSSLDYAKFGQLYVSKGKWKGKEIMNSDWVEKSLSRQMTIPETQLAIPAIDNEFYGYLFWIKTYRAKNKNYEVSYSSGNGGNKIFIFKDEPIVIVITSTAFNTPYAHQQTDKIMADYLIPAIVK